MTRSTVPALLAAATLLVSCDSFVSPKIQCQDITLVATLDYTPARKGLPCSFPEALLFTVTHVPKVDALWAAENGEPSDLNLANAPVTITRGSGAIGLCAGINCAATNPQIDTKVNAKGALYYELMLNLEGAGLTVGAGGKANYLGTAAVEAYSPGNSCPVILDVATSCTDLAE